MNFDLAGLSAREPQLNTTPENTPVTVRPLTIADKELQRAFFHSLSEQSRYRRFMGAKSHISESLLQSLSNTDQKSHVAFLACVGPNGRQTMIAEARYVTDPGDPERAEFAVAVADAWQGQGICRDLLTQLEKTASRSGVRRMVAVTLQDNIAMKRLACRFGYDFKPDPGEARSIRLVKSIPPASVIH